MLRYSPRCSRIFSRTAGGDALGSIVQLRGRQQTSIAVQPLARRRAAISCASAPQAMISVPCAFATHPLRRLRRLGGALGARAIRLFAVSTAIAASRQ